MGGDEGQGTARTNNNLDNLSYLTSQAQRSQDFASLTITEIPNSPSMDSPLIPYLFPLSQKDDLVALLPQEAGDDMVVDRKSSAPQPALFLIIPGDQRLSQWGPGQGTHESAFLSPTKEAQ